MNWSQLCDRLHVNPLSELSPLIAYSARHQGKLIFARLHTKHAVTSKQRFVPNSLVCCACTWDVHRLSFNSVRCLQSGVCPPQRSPPRRTVASDRYMDTHINLPLTNESFGLPLLNDENIETVASPETINTNGLIVLPTVSAHSSSPTTPKEDDLASAWQESMCASLNIPNGYRNVAVLLIRWDDYLDELKCANQVRTTSFASFSSLTVVKVNELKTVFEEQYNFDTELLKLHDKSKGQHQLNGGISAFLAKYDNPHNLVVRTLEIFVVNR